MKYKIGAIGRTKFLYDTIKVLHKNGHEIKIIITAPPAKEYRVGPSEFRKLAEAIGAEFFLVKSIDREFIKRFYDLDIGITVNWVSILSKEHITPFKIGILNAHMGDLPRYRGNACPNWAILNNEKEIVLTLHFVEPDKLDCGRIVLQKKFPLTEETYITHVYKWAENAVPHAFLEAVKILENNPTYILKYADCREESGFRTYPRLPEYSIIDWNESSGYIYRLIRASSFPFDGAYTYHFFNNEMKKLFIYQARIINESTPDFAVPGHILKNDKISGESWVKCGRGIIALKLCKYEGESKYFLPGKRWKSIRMRLGVNPQDMIYYLWKKLTVR